MSGQGWATLGTFMVSLLAVWVTYVSSRRSARVERTKVDADAYTRANEITDGLIDKLQSEVNRLNIQVAELRTALVHEERENEDLRNQLRALTATANTLRGEVAVLTKRLTR